MAALSSSLPSVSLAFHTPVVCRRRCRNNSVTTTSALRQRCLTGLTTNSSAMNSAFQNRGVSRISAVDPGSVGLDLSGVNLPIPPWAQWLVGAFVFAVPAYRQFRVMEDKVERTAEAAIEVIDKVAEETEKIAGEVADAFPGNEMIKEAAAKFKAVADEIEEDADKAEALIEKVDEIKKDIDSFIDPMIDKVSKEKH